MEEMEKFDYIILYQIFKGFQPKQISKLTNIERETILERVKILTKENYISRERRVFLLKYKLTAKGYQQISEKEGWNKEILSKVEEKELLITDYLVLESITKKKKIKDIGKELNISWNSLRERIGILRDKGYISESLKLRKKGFDMFEKEIEEETKKVRPLKEALLMGSIASSKKLIARSLTFTGTALKNTGRVIKNSLWEFPRRAGIALAYGFGFLMGMFLFLVFLVFLVLLVIIIV